MGSTGWEGRFPKPLAEEMWQAFPLYFQHLTCNALHDFKQSILIVKIKSNQIKSKEDRLLKEVCLFLDGKVDLQNHFVASFFHYFQHPIDQGFKVFLCSLSPKGQLISKCLFGAIVSTKKPTKFF